MNSSSSKERMRTDACELPADAALCFFQLRLTCVYGTSSLPVIHSGSLLLPLQFVSCDKSSWKLRIWKSGESERVQGKFNPGRGVANFQLWQLAPNRITLFPQFSCATAEEEGSVKKRFPLDSWDDFDCLRLRVISIDLMLCCLF